MTALDVVGLLTVEMFVDAKGKVRIDQPFGAHAQHLANEDTLERQPLPVGGNWQAVEFDGFGGVALVGRNGLHDDLLVEDALTMGVMKSMGAWRRR